MTVITAETKTLLTALLDDLNEAVREAAMHYTMVVVSNSNSPLFSEFAFTSICERVNDLSIPNRILACEMLGSFAHLDLGLLNLSLDKQSKKEGDWCASGAFVIALEDQFMAVRSAAIGSLLRISLARPEFAANAKALIIDAFNDEAHEVRQLAIEALHDICAKHPLDFDITHLESVLCLLDDGTGSLRHVSRRLLQVFRFPDTECLLRTVRCLHSAAKKYGGDLEEVCECLAAIGRNQAALVAACLPPMLKLDRFYVMPEPRVDDLYYGLKMILLYNAAMLVPELATEFPSFAYKHYTYFQLRFPQHLPRFDEADLSHPGHGLFYTR